VFIQYWGMRVMAYLALVGFALGLWGGFLLWRKKFETTRVFLWVCTWVVLVPFAMATAGWLLTESGRQPWIVQGLMLTSDGLSASGSATQVAIMVPKNQAAAFRALYSPPSIPTAPTAQPLSR